MKGPLFFFLNSSRIQNINNPHHPHQPATGEPENAMTWSRRCSASVSSPSRRTQTAAGLSCAPEHSQRPESEGPGGPR